MSQINSCTEVAAAAQETVDYKDVSLASYAHVNWLTFVVKLVLTTGTFGLGFFAGLTTCASLNNVSWSPA